MTSLADETQHAVDALRAVAHGIYPPLLESEGLESALRAVERTSSVPLRVDTHELARYDPEAEETAYFCVLETIERARMSGASSMSLAVAEAGAELVVSLTIEGRTTELDLTPVIDRIDAVGGTTSMDELAGGAMQITNVLPVATTVLESA